MYFSSKPNMDAQVAAVTKAFRSRLWILRNLKNSGFNADELLKVYKTMILPVMDYACVVYHSSLTDEQDETLDRLQNHTLKTIFSPELSGRSLRELPGVTTLRRRREKKCDKFASKCLANPLFDHWFPTKTARASSRHKNQEIFLESKARCQRLKDSPIYYLRRRLNGKPGKEYGTRYAEYREDT